MFSRLVVQEMQHGKSSNSAFFHGSVQKITGGGPAEQFLSLAGTVFEAATFFS
jgi:hypothetical protein